MPKLTAINTSIFTMATVMLTPHPLRTLDNWGFITQAVDIIKPNSSSPSSIFCISISCTTTRKDLQRFLESKISLSLHSFALSLPLGLFIFLPLSLSLSLSQSLSIYESMSSSPLSLYLSLYIYVCVYACVSMHVCVCVRVKKKIRESGIVSQKSMSISNILTWLFLV